MCHVKKKNVASILDSLTQKHKKKLLFWLGEIVSSPPCELFQGFKSQNANSRIAPQLDS